MSSHYVGQRISYDGALCTVRYIGEVAGANGSWLGVEWDDASRGKHDGSHKGKRYFSCLSRSPTVASFVRPTRPAEKGQSFISALNEKYVGTDQEKESQPAQIVIGTKVAEEMGFDKIRRQMAELTELKVAIVDGARVDKAVVDGDVSIQDTCPKVTQLDISRNLFETVGPVVDICAGLPALRKLAINGNRFRDVLTDSKLENAQNAFHGVTELGIGNVLLSWEEMCCIVTQFSSLASLTAGTNQLSNLPFINLSSLSATLTTINLEYNDFTAISNLASLTKLQNLRNLQLKGNNISIMAEKSEDNPIFPESLQYLDISYNNVETWPFVDSLPTHFPGLTALRIAHNPIYNAKAGDARVSTSEESHMFTIARVAQLKSINFSAITKADRTNAEMFYLTRIAKQLAEVPESAEKSITDLHPRFAELCQIYGEPDVIRRQEINPAFLEARLINVEFTCEGKETKSKRIPQAFDIYAVKGIAGRLFDISPLALKLVWETGEWDPVAGFEDSDDDSSDDEDESEATIETPGETGEKPGEQNPNSVEDKSGRWVRREVELTDSPRQLGYCVDGMDVKVRVEPK